MKYEKIWKKVLSPNEELKIEFSIGRRYINFWLTFWGLIGILLLFSIPFMGIVILLIALFYLGFYLKAANAYAFTNKRVLMHRGWLSTHTVSIDYEKITDISISEPFIERLITKTGTLAIDTAGTAEHEVVLRHITTPYEMKKRLEELRK